MSEPTLITALDQSINDAHARLMSLVDQSRITLLGTINTAREVGDLLIARKAQCKHGEFNALFTSASGVHNEKCVFHFTAEWGRTLMRFATALPESVEELGPAWTSLTDVMREVGALPSSTRTLQRAGKVGPFSRAVKVIGAFFSIIGKEKEKADVSDWPEEQRATLKEELRPVVELYEAL